MSKKWTSFEKASFWVAMLVLVVAILAWVTARPARQSGNATTKGDNSPAVTGDNNKTEINNGTPPEPKDKPSKPNEKDKP